jgi:hypothetical protein
MAIETTTRIKAEVIKGILDQLTGGNTVLEDRENSIKINISPDQKAWLQNFLDAQLQFNTTPDIEIDALGIILPVVWKRIWPYLALLGGGVAVLVLGQRRKRR